MAHSGQTSLPLRLRSTLTRANFTQEIYLCTRHWYTLKHDSDRRVLRGVHSILFNSKHVSRVTIHPCWRYELSLSRRCMNNSQEMFLIYTQMPLKHDIDRKVLRGVHFVSDRTGKGGGSGRCLWQATASTTSAREAFKTTPCLAVPPRTSGRVHHQI